MYTHFKHIEQQVLNIENLTGDLVGRDQYNNTHIHKYYQMIQHGTTEFANILEQLGLSQFIPQFQKNGLTDPYNFPLLGDENLKSMGFRIGHILKWRDRYSLSEKQIDDFSIVNTDKDSYEMGESYI